VIQKTVVAKAMKAWAVVLGFIFIAMQDDSKKISQLGWYR
jgi:hypothetical protein